jgi:cellulase
MFFRNAATLALAYATTGVSAHALMYGVWVNGVDQGDGRNVYIRTPPNNSPVKDLASPDIVCNVNGGRAVPDFVQASAGDTLTFEWLHNTRGDDIIDRSHLGPIITYIAPFTTGNPTGPVWTKIAEQGFNPSTRRWAVDDLIDNGGKTDFVLPASLAPGRYIIRQEIIAHHESETTFESNPARGAQFYPSCVQIQVSSGSGTAVPDQNFDFNTGYTYADPGIHFNIYTSFNSYSIPGPEVWTGASTGGGNGNGNGNATPTQPTPTPTVTPTPIETAQPVTTTTTSTRPFPTRCPGRRLKREEPKA